MEKRRGKGTDTLPTDNVFTRKEYIEREDGRKMQRQTNYDRIISKTPEELAKFIEFVSSGCDYMFPDCPAHDSCKLVCDQMDACRKGWIDWLKQEAKE